VVFEGGEGAGKSTQVRLLVDALRESGRTVTVTREPGGTRVGAAIRALLLDPATGALAERTEALLYAADRAEHVATVIGPALARGEVVISDRYVDSSLAYQGAGRSLPLADVAALSALATGGLVPHLTVLLDVDPEVGLGRLTSADRLEREGLDFHRRVREGFRALAAADPPRYLVLDAHDAADVLARAIRSRVESLLAAGSTP
jgi:dTMP kinase